MNIKKLRTKLGLSQAELASLLNTSQQHISKLEAFGAPKYVERILELYLEELKLQRHPESLVSNTPASDKYKLSLNSSGYKDFERWLYEITLLLDKIIPVHGYTNAQRVEMAINEIKRQYDCITPC